MNIFMLGEQFVAVLYAVILYGTLGTVAIPFVFFFLWTFFNFWKKHIWLFYVLLLVLYLGSIAVFYFTRGSWIYMYYSFPVWAQVAGLLFFVVSGTIVKIAERSITISVRFFYPLLKGVRFHLKTTGIYKYIRHPMYAVFPWFVFGVFLYTGQLILLPVFFFLLVTRTWWAKKEERYLKKIVVGDYDKYMKQTPNRFYPKFF